MLAFLFLTVSACWIGIKRTVRYGIFFLAEAQGTQRFIFKVYFISKHSLRFLREIRINTSSAILFFLAYSFFRGTRVLRINWVKSLAFVQNLSIAKA